MQLSAIRNLQEKDFDFLIVLLFDHNMNVNQAYQVPHAIIENYSVYRKHVNAHILHMRGPVLLDPRVVNLTEKFRE